MRTYPLLAARKTRGTVFRAIFVLALILGALGWMAPSGMTLAYQAPNVALNEIEISTSSTDWEFFEVTGTPGTSLSTLSLVGVDRFGAIFRIISLSGQSIPADGYWVAASPAAVSTYGITPDMNIADNTFTNNTTSYFLVDNNTGTNGQDLDTNDDGTLDVAPWSTLVDMVAFRDGDAADLDYGPPTIGPDGSYLPAGAYRCPNMTGSWNMLNFSTADGTPGTANCPPPAVALNEIEISTTSTDWEFVELAGTAGLDLSSVTLLGVDRFGAIFRVISLSGQAIPADGFWVAASPAAVSTYGITPDMNIADNTFTNNTTSYLLVYEFTGSNGQDLDTNNDGTLDVFPWDTLMDLVAFRDGDAADLDYGPPTIGPDGSYLPAGAYRCPDITGTWAMLNFSTADGTPGAANNCGSTGGFGTCGDNAETLIHTVQGTGDLGSIAPASGVVVEGVVVGDFQASDELDGFYIQEEDADADADPRTSEGLFVYDPGGTDVNVGDVVRVMGGITEYHNLTEMNSVTNLAICSTGATVTPTTVNLPVASLDDWENYEGMLIDIPETMTVTEIYLLGRYGEVLLAPSSQIYNFTHTNLPDVAGYTAFVDEFQRSTIFLDDLNNDQNVHPIYHPQPDGIVAPGDTLRGGWTLSGVTGVLSYSWSGYSGTDAYRIHPVDNSVYEPRFNTTPNPRPDTPPGVGGRVTVASFNVLNYFTTLGSRGANSVSEFNRQRAKIINAIVTMDADVVGLMEIENHPTDEALQNLVDGLNAMTSPGTYDYIATGVIGGDEIKVALIYQPARVTPVGAYAVLDGVAPFNVNTRPPLAQTFEENTSGALFTVAVNHFKSKSTTGCPSIPDPNADAGDGQGCWNGDRVLAAKELVKWLKTDPTHSGDTDYLIIGDLNSYAREDPITTLEGLGLVNLISRFEGATAYSYVFDGQWGYLDHALASKSMAQQVTGTNHWHINADEPTVLDYNEEFKPAAQIADVLSTELFRASDHDPVMIGLALDTVVTPSQSGGSGGTGGEPGIDVFDPAISKVGVLQPGGIGLAGEKLTWTITATNNGTAAGTDIVITDTMPAELSLDSAATERGTYSINGATVTFTIPYLNPGETVQMWVYTTVISSPLDGVIANQATLVSGSVTDSAVGTVNVVTSLPATGYPPSESRAPRSYTGVWLALASLLVIAVGGWRLRRARG